MAVKNQFVTVVLRREGIFIIFGFVFDSTDFYSRSHAGVQDFMVGVGHYVSARAFHRGKLRKILDTH